MSILFPAPNPPILSLFSSSDTFPSPLWSQHTDPQLPAESIIFPLLSDVSSAPRDALPSDSALVHCNPPSFVSDPPDSSSASASASSHVQQTPHGLLTHPVIQIQSPSIRTTYLRCPPSSSSELGIESEWLHVQFRRLGGRREVAIEVGLKDGRGTEGRVRLGSFIVRFNRLALALVLTRTTNSRHLLGKRTVL